MDDKSTPKQGDVKGTDIKYYDLTNCTHLCTISCGSLVLPTQLSMDAIEVNNALYTVEYKVNVLDENYYKVYVKGK